MPSANYLAWLEDPHTDRVLLADIQIREWLTDWTLYSGTVYYAPFLAYLATAQTAGGIYRQLDGVYQNGTALTVAPDLSTLLGAQGRYYYDPLVGGDAIYVNLFSGVHPNSVDFVGPLFTFFAGTSPKAFPGRPLYEPRLILNPGPTVQAQATEPLQGVRAFPVGDCWLANGDGVYDALSRTLIWDMGTVTFRFGGGSLAFSDYEPVAKLQIAKALAPGDSRAKIPLRTILDVENLRIPENGQSGIPTTFNDYYAPWPSLPGLRNDIRYWYMPVGFGTLKNAPAVHFQSEHSPGFDWWQMVNPQQFSVGLTGVRAVNKTTGQVVEFTTWTSDGVRLTIDNVLYPYTAWDIYFDGDVGNGYTRTHGGVAKQVLDWVGVPPADIDSASFAQADADAPFPMGFFAPGGTTTITVGDILERLDRSVLARTYRDPGTGIWKDQVWDPSNDFANVAVFQEGELAEFTPDGTITEILGSKVRLSYLADWGRGQAVPTVSHQDGQVATALGNPKQISVDSLLINATDAQTMVWRYAWIASSPVSRVKTKTSPRAMAMDVWGRGRFNRVRAPSTTGSWADAIMEIAEFTKDLASGNVDITLTNQRGVGEAVKMSAPDGTADWGASSTTDEKRTYGYAHDDTTERVDTTDPTTFHQAMAW